MTRLDLDRLRSLVDEAADAVPASPPPVARVVESGERAVRRRTAVVATCTAAALGVAIAGAVGLGLRRSTGPGPGAPDTVSSTAPSGPTTPTPPPTDPEPFRSLSGLWPVADVLDPLGQSMLFPEIAPGDDELFLVFDDGAFHGSDGCNAISGRYTLDGERLTFDKRSMASTLVGCLDGSVPLLQELQAVRYVRGANGVRRLLDGDRRVVVVLRR